MGTKLATIVVAFAVALFVAMGCGLNTDGMGDDDEFVPDAESDEAEPDVPEVADDVGMDETTPDETVEDVTEAEPDLPDETESEDAAEDEADETMDEGGEEDGDAEDGNTEDGEPDPCALPEIPATGIFIFYCFDYDLLSPMSLEFQAERAGIPVVSWRAAPGCSTTRGRRLECTLTPTVWDATYIFNIRLDPGVGIGWSCGPELLAIWGTPHVWLDGTELTVTSVTNGDGGCNHSFLSPSL